MQVKLLHPNAQLPARSTEGAGAFDIYMPTAGTVSPGETVFVNLGFAAAVPENHVALILPRSSTGCKLGLDLRNTCGVIDSDYRGEWKAALRTKSDKKVSPISWDAGDRLLQVLIVPVALVSMEQVDELSTTERGNQGFGSTGA